MSGELGAAIRQVRRNPLLVRSLITAFLTMVIDFIFHQSLTSPMEIPAYFAMKFFSALVIAYFGIPRIGFLWSAVVFTVWVDIYYGIFVVVLGIPGLSSSPTQIISIAGIMGQFILLPLWTLVHGFFFWISAYVAWRIPDL